MQRTKKHARAHLVVSGWPAPLFAALAMLGCAAQPPVRSEGPGPDLPVYVEGERFVFSNGRTERVLEGTPARVTWIDDRGIREVRSPDFVFSALERVAERSSTRREFEPFEHELWPLAAGITTRFRETRERISAGDSRQIVRRSWDCRVDGTESVTIAVGTFDAYRVACKRYDRRNRFRKTRVWYFAPRVGHPVLIEDVPLYANEETRRVELLAIVPPLETLGLRAPALASAEDAFQRTLENGLSGDWVAWKDEVAGIRVSTRPMGTFRTADGRYCRTFVREVVPDPAGRLYPGIACRGRDGRWRLPS